MPGKHELAGSKALHPGSHIFSDNQLQNGMRHANLNCNGILMLTSACLHVNAEEEDDDDDDDEALERIINATRAGAAEQRQDAARARSSAEDAASSLESIFAIG